MVDSLARNWWALTIRGVAAILFGILAIVSPGLTALVLVSFFGAYLLVDGIFALVGAVRAAERKTEWWPLVIEGIAGIAIGVLAFLLPGAMGLAILYLIAAWAIVTGIFEIVAAIRVRREIEGEFWMILGGIAAVVLGILIVIFPAAGVVTLIWVLGINAILFGIFLVMLSLRLRGHQQRRQQLAAG